MKNILQNVNQLFSTPGMLSAYSRWLLDKYIFRREPSLECIPGKSICGLASFSEYWTFLKGIPQNEQRFIENCLKQTSESSVAVDIGANLGSFTIALTSLGYSQVHAFEPVPKIFQSLSKNLRSNDLEKKSVLNCLAIGNSDGIVEFEIFDKSPAINKLLVSTKDSKKTTQKVKIIKLDKYCCERKIHVIDFLKIDVEGMEILALKGCEKLLTHQSIKFLLLEICPNNLQDLGFSVRELYEEMIKYSYFPYRIDDCGNFEKKLSLQDLENIDLENIAVVPESLIS